MELLELKDRSGLFFFFLFKVTVQCLLVAAAVVLFFSFTLIYQDEQITTNLKYSEGRGQVCCVRSKC